MNSRTLSHTPQGPLTFGRKLLRVEWMLIVLITLVACIGFLVQYSAAGGSVEPWAGQQMIRFGAGFVLMLSLALVDIRVWMRLAWPAYGVALVLLIGVEVMGDIGMGAQRWIDIGPMAIQPSEMMKLALVMALARWFHQLDRDEADRIIWLLPIVLAVLVPAALVIRQPDLGTALMIVGGATVIFFLAGVAIWKFLLAAAAVAALVPIAWTFLHDYQRQRVLTFLNPERDPLGAGYHIVQSKIALGSGGLFGRGFLEGSQSQLNFLPEKQTDFVFTMLAEEFGLAGCLFVLVLYALIIVYGYVIALRARSQFGRLLALGITSTFAIYVFINIAMVTGLAPVVGIPLPFLSYGGTVMLTLQICFGLLLSVAVHFDVDVPRKDQL